MFSDLTAATTRWWWRMAAVSEREQEAKREREHEERRTREERERWGAERLPLKHTDGDAAVSNSGGVTSDESTVVDDDDVQLEMFNFRWTRFRFQGRGLVKHVFTRSRFSCGSGDYLGSVHTGSVKTSQTGQWFGSGQAGWLVSALVPVDSVKPSRLSQTQVNSGSTQSTQDPEYYRCTLANYRSWNDTSESH
ncbi:uncharacterized protein LOC118484982 [Helianthus annuus]|uniref:uncharacterized protein LOC118484982 n=1 Tax=Helianthus annuus TaxID=4232 RepID=UPI001652D53B|nr:uncharacterized protein LOC118484982 [Helianthus annuus]